jgi:cyclic pyranopterin phosphate synthase
VKKNRTARYLRVSLLSSCNLRCSYCLPSGKHRPTVSAPVDKVRSAIRFLHRFGIRKVRFTGGEPTLSGDLPGLISYIKIIDASVHTAITSNGVLLESKARDLSAAGLDSVNISIDTLDPDKFRVLTGRDHLRRVISGIDAAITHIGNVKLNCVLIRGVNDGDVDKLILFADSRGLDIRFIEFMPNRYSAPGDTRFISSETIRSRLPWKFTMLPGKASNTARYYSSPSLGIKVGFIDSVSHPFCSGCDRIRLTADGFLHTCLYDPNGINLFELLAADSDKARVKVETLLRSKRSGNRPGVPVDALPSFSAMGG